MDSWRSQESRSNPLLMVRYLQRLFGNKSAFRRVGRANGIKQILVRWWREEKGQDLTECALLLVVVALAAIASMNTLANAITTVFSTAAANLSAS